MKSMLPLLTALLLLSFQSSRGAQQPPVPNAAPGKIAQLRALEAAMMAAAAEKGADGYMSFYADDAVELPNGAEMLQGKESIRKAMEFLNDKNNHLTWTPVHVDVAQSDDLAYTYGVFEFRSIDKEGKPSFERGKYTTVWKKQKDGRWEVILDMGNASPDPNGQR
jgi:uncharacterized protein (TIGR02246 family)